MIDEEKLNKTMTYSKALEGVRKAYNDGAEYGRKEIAKEILQDLYDRANQSKRHNVILTDLDIENLAKECNVWVEK